MTVRETVRRILPRLADALWPRTCPVADCGAPSDRPGRHLCSRCFAGLPFRAAGGMCRVCGLTIASDTPLSFTCEDCAAHPPPYAARRSAVKYAPPADDLIKAFKYGGATWLADDLTDLLEGAVRLLPAPAAVDVVMPVPLHPNRLRTRGYNQSALLAENLARRLDRRFDAAALARTRDTAHQARLSAEERRRNVEGAFAAVRPERVRGRTVLLVDDVFTRGFTLANCARALRAAGAAAVLCTTVAVRED